MKIVLYNDISIIIDNIQLSKGTNMIDIDPIGYIPGTLYVDTTYPYTIDDTIISIDCDRDDVSISYIYTSNAINGYIQYEYDIDKGIYGSLILDGNMPIYDDTELCIGTSISYTEQDHNDDNIIYNSIGTYNDISIDIDGDMIYMIDVDHSIHKMISFYGNVYPGILVYDNKRYAIDSDTSSITIGPTSDIGISYDEDGCLLVDNNLYPYIQIETMYRNISIYDYNDDRVDTYRTYDGYVGFYTLGIGTYRLVVE